MSEEISPLENHGWWMERLRKDAKANRPEALRLADIIEQDPTTTWGYREASHAAAADLRRLHELNGELLEALKLIASAENSALDLAYCKGIARAAIAEGQ
jgi:hypothetical protein